MNTKKKVVLAVVVAGVVIYIRSDSANRRRNQAIEKQIRDGAATTQGQWVGPLAPLKYAKVKAMHWALSTPDLTVVQPLFNPTPAAARRLRG